MKELMFIHANATWPKGVIWSTARRGTKWLTDVKGGDVVALMETESYKHLGHATVIRTLETTFKGACDTAGADKNHALTPTMDDKDAAGMLAAGLKAAYGDDLKDDEVFTIIFLIAHNEG